LLFYWKGIHLNILDKINPQHTRPLALALKKLKTQNSKTGNM
jgi:hypothetical protein